MTHRATQPTCSCVFHPADVSVKQTLKELSELKSYSELSEVCMLHR